MDRICWRGTPNTGCLSRPSINARRSFFVSRSDVTCCGSNNKGLFLCTVEPFVNVDVDDDDDVDDNGLSPSQPLSQKPSTQSCTVLFFVVSVVVIVPP
mmetsp:Transcript_32773/g.46570  ORF Transcript_32773/g.46570 Transcript_32773/m.46570 type:complete len:98 (+) Transcript_32773:117-410(+)